MNLKNTSILVLVLLTSLLGCQKNKTSGFSSSIGITLDNSVPENQRDLIDADLSLLASLSINDVSSTDLQVIGLSSFSGPELVSWLTNRTRFIVGESFDYAEQANIVGDLSYRPQIFSASIENRLLEENSLTTIMINIGGALYRYGKKNSQVLTLDVGGQRVYVKSPRVGVVQIGEGLFTAWSVKSSASDSLANSLIRLSVFFHESRHSDGNGDNVTFPHALCPSWHDYSGNYSCDKSYNGPYMVDAAMLRNLKNACSGCSNTEIQTFRAFQADAESRLLESEATWKDIRPEQIP